jgi:hypothetical protein
MPHRFDRAILVGDLARRRTGARRARHGGGRQISRAARRQAVAAVHAALRSSRARSGLHQGLSARHPREWRPIHPWRVWAAQWRSPCRATATRPANCCRCSIRSAIPTAHGRMHRYKVEPYVACADVYSVPPHVGRGGWTWYTGSAGWMYRVTRWNGCSASGCRGNLALDPCIPRTIGRASKSRSAIARALRDHGRESARRLPRHSRDQARRRDADRETRNCLFPWWTTAPRIGAGRSGMKIARMTWPKR